MTQHYDPDTLQAFVKGRLSETETEAVVAHLADCDVCLAAVDQLWAEQPLATHAPFVRDFDPTAVKALENRLLNRLHRSNLGSRTIWLGTAGLINTLLAIVRPFFSSSQASKRKGSEQ